METDQAVVTRFSELLGCPEPTARFCLDACGGNFDAALSMYYEQVGRAGQQAPPAAGQDPILPRLLFQMVTGVLLVPYSVLRLALQAVFGGLRLSTATLLAALPRPLADAILARARAASAAVAPYRAQLPAAEAAQFARQLTHRYGSGPEWTQAGWQDAAAAATAEGKLLFVYLHSPRHADTDAFVRTVLMDEAVTSFIDRDFVAWGGSVTEREGFALAQAIGAARFPCTALLAFSGNRTQLAAVTEGACSVDELLATLQEVNRRLREQQDAELQQSLAEDRRRQEEAEAATAALEEERRREEAMQEAKRQAGAEAAAVAATAAAAVEERRSSKRAALRPEPAVGCAGVAAVRLRLPDGSAFQRRFLEEDTLQTVHDWVDGLDGTPWEYALATTFPRRVYQGLDLKQTLLALGLTPQATLLLQPAPI